MIKKKIYIWCCDFNTNSGEGIIANKFVKDLKKYNKRYLINIKISKSNKKTYFLNALYTHILGLYIYGKFILQKKIKMFVMLIIYHCGIFNFLVITT